MDNKFLFETHNWHLGRIDIHGPISMIQLQNVVFPEQRFIIWVVSFSCDIHLLLRVLKNPQLTMVCLSADKTKFCQECNYETKTSS